MPEEWKKTFARQTDVLIARVDENRRSRFVILPDAWWLKYWETVMLLVGMYTVAVTPFEIGFLTSTSIALFAINRFVDFCFLSDMVLICFRAYLDPEKQILVRDLARIRRRYLRSASFAFDLVSLVSGAIEITEFALAGNNQRLRGVGFQRFLRVIRLLRIIKIARSIGPLSQFETPFLLRGLDEVSFYWKELLRALSELLITGHFVACLWGYIAILVTDASNGQTETWVDPVIKSGFATRDNAATLYMLAVHWAAIGFAAQTPYCHAEYLVAVLAMVVLATRWVVFIAAVSNLGEKLDEERLIEGFQMQSLWEMCRDLKLEPSLRRRLGDYLMRSRRVQQTQRHTQVIWMMSPALQCEIAVKQNGVHLDHVPFLKGAEAALITGLATVLEVEIYSSEEWIIPFAQQAFVKISTVDLFDFTQSQARLVTKGRRAELASHHEPPLTILQKGLAIRRILHGKGAVWHEDILLQRAGLRDQQVAQALSFCTAYHLSGEAFFTTLENGDFPAAKENIKRRALQLKWQRVMAKAARERKQEEADGSSDSEDANYEIRPKGANGSDPLSAESETKQLLLSLSREQAALVSMVKGIAERQQVMERRIMAQKRGIEAHRAR